MSRRPFRFWTSGLPEVGLDFRLGGLQKSVYNVDFGVSRGRFRIVTSRCPEVRLEVRLLGVQTASVDIRLGGVKRSV